MYAKGVLPRWYPGGYPHPGVLGTQEATPIPVYRAIWDDKWAIWGVKWAIMGAKWTSNGP